MPSVRRRLVGANARSKWRASKLEIAVSWWTITSGWALAIAAATWSAIERVGHHRRGAELVDRSLLGLAASHPGHLVARLHEPRHQLLAHRSGCTCEKDLHFGSISSVRNGDETARPSVTVVIHAVVVGGGIGVVAASRGRPADSARARAVRRFALSLAVLAQPHLEEHEQHGAAEPERDQHECQQLAGQAGHEHCAQGSDHREHAGRSERQDPRAPRHRLPDVSEA